MNLLIGIFFLTSLALQAMEAPLPQPHPVEIKTEIPNNIKKKYEEEQKKFHEYDLDHPEKFLNLLRKQLNKEENLPSYIFNLQIFVSKLFIQQILMRENIILGYVANHRDKIIDESKNLKKILTIQTNPLTLKEKKELGFQKEIEELILQPELQEQLNELFLNSKIIAQIYQHFNKPFNAKELDFIYYLVADKTLGNWLNLFGNFLLKRHQENLFDILRNKYDTATFDIIAEIYAIRFPPLQEKASLIKQNTEYLSKLVGITIGLEIRQRSAKRGLQQTTMAASLEEDKINNLYSLTHSYYEQLYKIVYAELKLSILQLMRENPSDKTLLKKFLSIIPDTLIPSLKVSSPLLPSQLPSLIDPHTIPLPSYEKELEEFQSKWQKEHLIIQEVSPAKEIEEKKQRKPKKEKLPKKTSPSLGEPELKQEVTKEEKEVPRSAQKIKEGSDKSYILESDETKKHIIIHDPKNNISLTLFKTDRPYSITESLPEKNYTEWVLSWFKNPQQALKTQGYTNLNSKKFTPVSEYWKPIALHSFALLVDDYIGHWGTLEKIQSRRDKNRLDYLITIPGSIKYPNGTQETGVFSYLIDSRNGQWYHRMFEPQSGTKLLKDLFSFGYFSPEMKGYYDVYFPPLGKK